MILRLTRWLFVGLLAGGSIVSSEPRSLSSESGGVSASDTQKPVHVKGYTRKDGTKVKAYDRKAPKSTAPKTSTKKSVKTTEAYTTSAGTTVHNANYCQTCARDKHGRILRGGKAKHEFERMTGYPRGRKGYVVDHIMPLACGGADNTSNMQWQTVEQAKLKDAWERDGCRSARP